jgi:hypothetical protein
VDGSAATSTPGVRFASIQSCATTRVSVFASSRVSPIDQTERDDEQQQGH